MEKPKLLVECPICRRRFTVRDLTERLPRHPLDEYPEVECLGSGQPGEVPRPT